MARQRPEHHLRVGRLVAADFSMLNERLARHYGIEGAAGMEFRQRPPPSGSHRGGVLTMASVLKVTANGATTSPVTRGARVLDRILGAPPPRPPADAPAIAPDIRGATTIREQLERHRGDAACAACHAKIDPHGFALESFDVIGGRRDRYRTTGLGDPLVLNGRRRPYLHGPAVDSSGVLAGGEAFGNIDEYKRLLLADPDSIAHSLTQRRVTCATGAPPTRANLGEVAAIVATSRERNFGLRSLAHAVVQSEMFRNK